MIVRGTLITADACDGMPADLDGDTVTVLAPTCPACGGPGALLGRMGQRLHLRCIDCGIDFSRVEEGP